MLVLQVVFRWRDCQPGPSYHSLGAGLLLVLPLSDFSRCLSVFGVESTAVVDSPTVALDWLLAVWLLAVGACIGSFLNVVILRLPADVSIVSGGSRCPRCRHAIRWYDNIPLVSWLMLRARCRDCGAAIPARYPAVELLMAVIFLVLGLAEPLDGAANLPGYRTAELSGAGPVPLSWSIYAYHLTLIVTLVAAAVIAWDGHRVPYRLFLVAMVVGVAGPCFEPLLHPVPALAESIRPSLVAALLDLVAGAVSGLVLGLAISPLWASPGGLGRLAAHVLIPAGLVGLFLGWQAALMLIPVTTALWLAARALTGLWSGRRIPWCGILAAGALLLIMYWRWLDRAGWLFGLEAAWADAAAIVLIVAGLALGGRLLGIPAPHSAVLHKTNTADELEGESR